MSISFLLHSVLKNDTFNKVSNEQNVNFIEKVVNFVELMLFFVELNRFSLN
jgi:hypothetical protein